MPEDNQTNQNTQETPTMNATEPVNTVPEPQPQPQDPVTEPVDQTPTIDTQPEMAPTPQSTPPQDAPTQPPTPENTPAPKSGSGILPFIFGLLIIVVIGGAGFYLYKSGYLESIFPMTPKPTAAPVKMATEVPTPTVNPTEGWKTYTNSVHNLTFKYPGTWTLKAENEKAKQNTVLTLTKGEATIKMYLNMVGIGGVGQDYEGKPYTLDGNLLYEYTTNISTDNSTTIGITDTLTNTLGVFKIDEITYSITLNYPQNYAQAEAIKQEFDQILSTFHITKALMSAEPSASPVSSPSSTPASL